MLKSIVYGPVQKIQVVTNCDHNKNIKNKSDRKRYLFICRIDICYENVFRVRWPWLFRYSVGIPVRWANELVRGVVLCAGTIQDKETVLGFFSKQSWQSRPGREIITDVLFVCYHGYSSLKIPCTSWTIIRKWQRCRSLWQANQAFWILLYSRRPWFHWS